jgi:hypothetical protein
MKTIEEVMNAFEGAALTPPLTSHTEDDFDTGDFDPYTEKI